MRTRENGINIIDLVCEYSSPYNKGKVGSTGLVTPINI
jgi:hypothetical protein